MSAAIPGPALLVALSAGVILVLGCIHLLYTFRGEKLHPRDPALRAQMAQVAPRITRETTVWKAWLGFNASHSYGAMLFGLLYAYLALAQPALLLGSAFLLGVGALLLAGYLHLAWRYWFRIPQAGIALAAALYAAALVMSLT